MLHDFEPETETLRAEVLDALRARPRSIPSKYLYDERGSALFERICEVDEYYLTRTETAILTERVDEIGALLGPRALLVEYGSGSSTKTRIVLDHFGDLAGYVPIDISREALLLSAESLRARYPHLPVFPVCADYTADYELPKLEPREQRRVVWFPGSTIGNLTSDEAEPFLKHIARVAGPRGGLLIGVDLHKATEVLEAAYDDAQGVSAEFALNVLDRLNREIGADFDRSAFTYAAEYDVSRMRIEMSIVSQADQVVRIGDVEIPLEEGERIRTEYSHKYTLESFAELASRAGLRVESVWTDPKSLFSVQYLTVA